VTRGRRAHPPAHNPAPLLKNAYSLALNVILTSALGLGFWIAAARIFPSSTVGRDAALLAAMLTLSSICQLNMAVAIPRLLPIVRHRPERIVWGAYLLTAAVSILGAIAFVVIAPALSHGYRFLSTQPAMALLFAAAVVVWGVFTLEDAVLTAARRAVWVPVENTIFGVLKIAALPLMLAVASSHPVFIAWNAPVVALVIPVNVFIFLRVLRKPISASGTGSSPIERFGLRGLLAFLAQDYVAFVFVQACAGMLPVLVVALLGGSAGAYFFMPFALVISFDSLFAYVLQPLTVEAALAEPRLPELSRVIVRHFGWLLIVGIIVLAAGASLILAPYGASYARHGATVLRLLAFASLFRAITALYVCMCRVEGRATRILSTQAATFALLIVLVAVLAPTDGIVGVAVAWLVTSIVIAGANVGHVVAVLRRPLPDPPLPGAQVAAAAAPQSASAADLASGKLLG
jgi:O-antigen/teichoic acid export membrane protein